MTQKTFDSIIEELHHTRENIAARFNGDIAAMVADAARRQALAQRPMWQPKTSLPAAGLISKEDK